MGYHSEVAITFSKKAADKMPQGVLDALQSLFVGHEDLRDGGRLYHSSWLKWYYAEKEESAILDYMNVLNVLHDDDSNLTYEFLRIGEDEGDIERMGNDEEGYKLWTETKIDLGNLEIVPKEETTQQVTTEGN